MLLNLPLLDKNTVKTAILSNIITIFKNVIYSCVGKSELLQCSISHDHLESFRILKTVVLLIHSFIHSLIWINLEQYSLTNNRLNRFILNINCL